MLSNDGEDEAEVQQKTLQVVLNSLKEQLEERQWAAKDKGKRKVAEAKKIDWEALALQVMLRADKNGTTLDSEV